ncbi:MAG: alpha/beta fold hydrolase [Verrucomicrobia bacterium]|nr:alpha/beta fold hydrolase [Verrucomicrobiota bacterium]MCH8526874.1 alpha/beta fold hydrolase [Kiritimatiellia bacterium]
MKVSETRGIWLHGFLGEGSDGSKLFATDSRTGRQDILRPTLPGHGSPAEPICSLSQTLDHIARLASGRDWAAGYSMGGRLLMMAAARHPDAFSTLILESASLGYADPAARAARLALDQERADRLRSIGLPAFTDWWYTLPLWDGSSPPPERHGDPEALAAALTTFSSGRQPDMRTWLRTTSCRVLWLAGERDRAYAKQSKEVERIAPRVYVVRIPDAGHNIHRDQPDRWHEAVRNFLISSLHPNQKEQ